MEEENLLEYRPSFERPERLATNWVKEDKRAENDIPKQEAHDQEAGSGIATELVKEQKDLQSSIEEKLKTLEKNTKIQSLTTTVVTMMMFCARKKRLVSLETD